MRKALGIDIGGTKIAAGIVTETGELLHRAEVASDPSDKEKMFAKVIEAADKSLKAASLSWEEIAGIGAGVPGKVDRTAGIAVFQNNLPWAGFPVAKRLREHTGVSRIVIDNDVYMAAYAEWKDAKAGKDETFVYLTVSTGISCAVIHKGDFFRGAGFAGEAGLIPVLSKTAGGQNERLEKVAAGPAIGRSASDLTGKPLDARAVFSGYLEGDPQAAEIVRESADNIAQGLYSISCLLDPHQLVFGGSVVVNNPFLLEMIKERLRNYQLPEQQHLLNKMGVSRLKQDNGVVGAGLSVWAEN